MKTLAKEERLRWWAYGPHQFLEILRRTFIVDLHDVDSQPEIIDAVQEPASGTAPIWWWEMEFEPKGAVTKWEG